MTQVQHSRLPAAKPAEPNGKPLLDAVVEQTANSLELMAERYAKEINDPAVSRLKRAILVGAGVATLRNMLTDDIMNRFFLPLANSPLGFMCDRPNKNHGPYSVGEIRECVVASLLAGLYPYDNEWNIIAGRMMVVKNGWRRKVMESPGVADAWLAPGAPLIDGSIAKVRVAGTVVKSDGQVIQLVDHEGKPGRVFTIVRRDTDGFDLLVGKAERRAWKALFERIHGATVPIMQDEEEGTEEAKEVPAAQPAKTKTDKLAEKLGVEPPATTTPLGNANPPQGAPEVSEERQAGEEPEESHHERQEFKRDVLARLEKATTMVVTQEIGADLVKYRDWIGEELYGSLVGELQAKNQEIMAAAKPSQQGKKQRF